MKDLFSGLNDACEFKHGQGFGEIVFKSGDRYLGEFCKGRRQGKGQVKFAEGNQIKVFSNILWNSEFIYFAP